MTRGSIVVALLTLVGGSSAWARAGGGAAGGGAAGGSAAGGSAQGGNASSGPPASGGSPVGGGSTAGGIGTAGAGGVGGTGGTVMRGAAPAPSTGATNGNISNNDANTPPPPVSVTSTGSNAGVPPTPAPAFPGLPSPTQAGTLPSDRGFDAQTNNELRPSSSLNVGQVANVQASLAAGGLYRGPIDGNMTASTRAAIRQFQEASRLPATGELDAQTMRTLAGTAANGSAGANGTTSTTGNRAAAGDPFSTTFTGVPTTTGTGTVGGGQTGPIFSTPFPLSNPINTSPTASPSATVQP